jgi:transmembrane sensor
MTTGTSETGQDAIREAALDWLLRVNAAPEDPALRAARDAWLAEREAHANAYRKAERAWHLTGEIAPAYADRWATKAAPTPATPGHRLEARDAPRRGRAGWTLAVGALAACIALFAVAPALQLRLRADHVTATGQSLQTTLEDGTVVSLDTGTAIGTRFTPAGREASLLSGKAFFQIAPDRRRPFSVHAANATVTVTGTAFSVDLSASEIAVAVQSGSVEVSHPGNATATKLRPGDRLQLDRATNAATRGTVDGAHIAAWRHGQLVIENAPISHVVDELRRYHRGFIVIRDDALARRRVTGVYDLHDPAAALRAAVQPYAGRVREWSPYLLVISGS